ncbi:MAG TPA: TIGR02147 family protein [Chitinivibrionales bacterium]|jgi:uncharacterized protein (TIGR02147 family)|nr:TIGR02147 family protein [Chitinivibrionales bacterium]
MKAIFEYTDFRQYLADFYAFQKRTTPGFSHRLFLQKAGMSGPNFLKNVIDGKKNLSADSIKKFAKACGLSIKETEYFSNLVRYNQARTLQEKQNYFMLLSGFSHRSEIQKIRTDQFDYLSRWYNLAIREYIHSHKFHDDYRGLVKAIIPKITARQVKKSIGLLIDLGLIRPGQDGFYQVSDRIISTGSDINSIAARNLHKSMMEISCRVTDSTPAEEQYLRTIMGSFSDEAFGRIKLELDNTRKRILDIISQDTGTSRKVHSIGIQLLPLEQTPRKRGRPS